MIRPASLALLAAVAAAASPAGGCAQPASRHALPAATPAPAATLCAELPETIIPSSWQLLPAVDVRGRRPFRADAVFARHLLDPLAPAPHAGESLTGETGEPQSWEARQAEPDGSMPGEFAWGYAAVTSPASRVMLAELSGAGALFVNGDGAAGDPYRSGFGLAPVALHAGVNHLFVSGVRDGFRLVLREPEHALLLELSDTTLPDLLAGGTSATGDGTQGELAVTVINASLRAVPQLTLATGGVTASEAGVGGVETGAAASVFDEIVMRDEELPGLPPLGVVKVAVRFAYKPGTTLPEAPASYELAVRYGGHPDEPARSATLRLESRAPDAPRRVTRRSPIDDSVQEYALRAPAHTGDETGDETGAAQPGVVLTLHGAGVDSFAQVSSYAPKPDFWIVAPSNRRPFGFDWQDWGRLDGYETLEHALALTGADGTRVALTGHSMGGHGSWHLAVNDADRFLAVAPSAGWSSFDSYPGRPAGALSATWHAADGASDTFALLPNLVKTPVYVLHGSADDNVPASEGRALHEALVAAVATARAHDLAVIEPQLHVQEGAGHWWDGDASPGVDCVDWPPIFELFRKQVPWGAGHPIPSRFEWVCADPAIDSRQHWISVIQPLEYGRPVRITASWDAAARHVELSTQNAATLILHWPDGQMPASCSVDSQPVSCGTELGSGRKLLDRGDLIERRDGNWVVSPVYTNQLEREGWDPAQKSPARSGPFKRAFDNRFVLVYGTAGDEREDAELLARARYDSEVWRYRGNGCAQVWSDLDFLAPGNLARMSGRNVILYGNLDTNLGFQALVPPDCPLRAERGKISLGEQVFEGDDLAALCVYPRVGDEAALLGLFADTGPSGSRLGYTLAPFVSGVGCPDFAIFDASVLAAGDSEVRSAGWFDSRWNPP